MLRTMGVLCLLVTIAATGSAYCQDAEPPPPNELPNEPPQIPVELKQHLRGIQNQLRLQLRDVERKLEMQVPAIGGPKPVQVEIQRFQKLIEEELEEVIEDRELVEFGIGPARGQWIKEQEAVRLRYLTDRIEDVDKVCELSKTQRKRLEIAAKGAVHYAFEPLQAELAKHPNHEDVALAPHPAFLPGRENTIAIVRQPIWVRAYERALSGQQRARYATSLAVRAATRRKELVDQMVKVTSASISGLSPAQLADVRKLMSQVLEQQWRDHDPFEVIVARKVGDAFAAVNVPMQPHLKKFLKPAQLARWKTLRGRRSDRVIVWENGEFRPGVQVIDVEDLDFPRLPILIEPDPPDEN